MDPIVEDLFRGGEYSADLVEIFINNVLVYSYYYDGPEDDDYDAEEIYNLLEDNRDQVITIIGYRALQGMKPTESITIDKNVYKMYDYFTGKTKFYNVFPASSR